MAEKEAGGRMRKRRRWWKRKRRGGVCGKPEETRLRLGFLLLGFN